MRATSTIRLRLTLWYGGLFLLTGFALLAINFLLVRQTFPANPTAYREQAAQKLGVPVEAFTSPRRSQFPRDVGPPATFRLGDVLDTAAQQIKADTLRQLLLQSTILLGLLAVPSLGLGWLMAGRMLRPISEITDTVRRITDESLHERVSLAGPDDELKELADQFDVMLDRLQRAFTAQRSFVANAAHELRTPLTVIRTELDVTLGDPDVPPADLAHMAEVVRRALARSQDLIDALLTLARADSPPGPPAAVDLAELVQRTLAGHADEARAAGVSVDSALAPADVLGDRVLLERMIENLVANAITHNRPDGWLRVSTSVDDGNAVIVVTNSGDAIDPSEVEGLFERFARRDTSRSRATGGYGLGLSIVRAVAEHHQGRATGRALDDGGLEVRVAIPQRGTAAHG